MPQNLPLLRSFALLSFVFVQFTTANWSPHQVSFQYPWVTWFNQPSTAQIVSSNQISIQNGFGWPNGRFFNRDLDNLFEDLLFPLQTCECPCEDDQQNPAVTLPFSLSMHLIFKRHLVQGRCSGVIMQNGKCRKTSKLRQRQRRRRNFKLNSRNIFR